jgi:hypothetical protein
MQIITPEYPLYVFINGWEKWGGYISAKLSRIEVVIYPDLIVKEQKVTFELLL